MIRAADTYADRDLAFRRELELRLTELSKSLKEALLGRNSGSGFKLNF
jgi:hypothetical protein